MSKTKLCGWFGGQSAQQYYLYNKCLSIKARREVYSEPICLDGELIIKTEPKETIKIGNNTYNKEEVETALKDVKSL